MSINNYGIIKGNNFLTVIADKAYSITTADARYGQAVEFVKRKAWDKFFTLMDKPAAIARYSNGAVQVFDEEIRYKGVPVHGVVVDRILKFVNEGFDFKPLVAFLENLYENTDANIREKLYIFLEKNELAITDKGSFLAFKLVKDDYTPIYHAGKFINENGAWVSKYAVGEKFFYPKEKIVKTTNECSTEGIYVGNKSYWNGQFDADNNYTGDGRMLIVEVFPQHVCNVPHADCTKIVVCELNVLSEYKVVRAKANKALYTDDVPAVKEVNSNEDLFADLESEEVQYVVGVPARDASGRFAKKQTQKFHNRRGANGRFIRAKKLRRDASGRFVS